MFRITIFGLAVLACVNCQYYPVSSGNLAVLASKLANCGSPCVPTGPCMPTNPCVTPCGSTCGNNYVPNFSILPQALSVPITRPAQCATACASTVPCMPVTPYEQFPPVQFIPPCNNCNGCAPSTSLGCLDPVPGPCGCVIELPVPSCGCRLTSPFLPAASPVSAMAPPVSPLLPASCPCNCRCEYLKKIAIPPPCI